MRGDTGVRVDSLQEHRVSLPRDARTAELGLDSRSRRNSPPSRSYLRVRFFAAPREPRLALTVFFFGGAGFAGFAATLRPPLLAPAAADCLCTLMLPRRGAAPRFLRSLAISRTFLPERLDFWRSARIDLTASSGSTSTIIARP